MNMFLSSLIALITGALSAAAFAPIGYHYLGFIAPAIFLFLLHAQKPRAAFWLGFCYGLSLFGIGVSWFFVSIHTFGGTGVFLSAVFTSLPIIAMSCILGIGCYLANRITRNNTGVKVLLLIPSLILLTEWVRHWLFSGFPWLQFGDSQAQGILGGFIPIVGRLGETWVVWFMAGLLYLVIKRRQLRQYFAIVAFMLMWISGVRLNHINWTKPTGKTLSVSLVQGNIKQSMRWDPAFMVHNIQTYITLSKPHWQKNHLIVWPENSIPIPPPDSDAILLKLHLFAKQHHAWLVTGLPVPARDGEDYYNSLLLIGQSRGEYFKRHLVPFGEYVPFKNQLKGLLTFFDLPMSDFIPGPNTPLLKVNDILIAPFICYEITFSDLVLSDLPKAQLLMVLSNDAWFGHSFAASQHLEIAQMQARATGRTILFSTNNGVTAIIGPHGHIIKHLARFKPAVLNASVAARTGETPWVAIGQSPFIWLSFFILFITILLKRIRNEATR
jgi:apolipoprotein N-acyltransferase